MFSIQLKYCINTFIIKFVKLFKTFKLLINSNLFHKMKFYYSLKKLWKFRGSSQKARLKKKPGFSWKNLSRIPVLTKTDVRRFYLQFLKLKFIKYKLYTKILIWMQEKNLNTYINTYPCRKRVIVRFIGKIWIQISRLLLQFYLIYFFW